VDKIQTPVSGKRAREYILEGVNAVYDFVKLTLGPSGKNAIIPRTYNRGPRITTDGYTVSENIIPKNPYVKLVASAFKEGSAKTNRIAGDSTTTTAVISGFQINKIFKGLDEVSVPTAGVSKTTNTNVRALRKEMKDIKDIVMEKVKERAVKVTSLEELEKIAVISIGKEDEDIAKIVAKTVWEIGVDNHIDIVEGFKGGVETEITKGMRLPMKIAAKAFVNNPERFEMIAEDVAVLITNYKMDNPFEMVGIMNMLKLSKVVIFAPDFSQNVLLSLVNSIKNGITYYPIKVPGLRTEQFEDLAAYTDSKFINKDLGNKLSAITVKDLGFATKVVVKDTEAREDGVVLGGRGEKQRFDEAVGVLSPIDDRIKILKKQIEESKTELVTVSLQKRIANLSSAVGVIRVGAPTDDELLFLKHKIEDGVYACKGALEEGYVKGGGLCLKEIAEEMEENILTEALKEPYEQIQTNAGGNLEISKDVIDSAKSIRCAVLYGVDIASSMITCDILIPEIPEITEGEANAQIAKAINRYCYLFARQHGIITASENEQEKDRNSEFERIMAGDRD